MTMHMPVSGVDMAWWPLLLIGFTVGVVGGYFGLGGAWLITPALNIFGFPMIYAVGTDHAHIVGKSIVATFRHWRFGHVSALVAIFMLIGTFSGIEIGAQVLFALTKAGMAGSVVRYIYMALLLLMCYFMTSEYFKAKKKEKETGKVVGDIVGTSVSKWIHETLDVPPKFYCKTSKFTFSVWSVIFVGVLTGFVAGILGIGGGLIRVPALIYFVGLPTKVAVGTDLFEVAFSGAYGTFTYSLKGGVELITAVIMLLGAAIGAQFGTVTTKYVHGIMIRLVFGIATFFAFTSVATRQYAGMKQALFKNDIVAMLTDAGFGPVERDAMLMNREHMYHWMVEVANRPDWFEAWQVFHTWTVVAGAIMLLAASGLCLFILYQFFLGVAKEKREQREQKAQA